MPKILHRRSELAAGVLLSLVSFAGYVLALAPTVSFIDSGELATVAATLGIAHPTGYPLFTILAHTFYLIPLGLREIVQLNLFAAILCAVSVYFFFRAFCVVGRELPAGPGKSRGDGDDFNWKVLLPAGLGALILAFSETFWSQALSIEVYPLHLL